MKVDLKGKKIIVTGAAGGIGTALAKQFIKQEPRYLLLLDLHLESLLRLSNSFSQDVRDATIIDVAVCDVSKAQDIHDVVRRVELKHDGVDLFCSNAGVFIPGGVDVETQAWQQSFDVNVMAHIHAVNACLPTMISRGSGYFLQTISAAGLLSQIGSAPYSVSKHAALAFAEWVAITHGEQGIKVTALCPQGVSTAMLDDIDNINTVAGDGLLSADEVAATAIEAINKEVFLALPHPRVSEYEMRRAENHDRWIIGMQRLQAKLLASE